MQNHIEQEAKILDIDTGVVVEKLQKNGARKILDAITIIETYDVYGTHIPKKRGRSELHQRYSRIIAEVEKFTQSKNSLLSQGAYLRLRQEGKRSELILKYGTGKKDVRIKSEREISISVRSKKEWKSVQAMLEERGLRKVFYQEKHRISYVYDKANLRFDIDTWPGVPTYIEIEGASNEAIKKGARMIGYRASDLRSFKAKEVFKKYSISPIFLTFKKNSVQITHNKLLTVMHSALSKRGIVKKDADWIVNHYYEAELMGKKTHGVGKFCWDMQFYDQRISKPKVIKDSYAVAIVDGNREIGPLAARFCIDLVTKKANQFGIAVIGLRNFQRYGVLATWTKTIAEKGLVGIVTNSTEPFVVPPNGKKIPVLGTNPLSIGFPTATNPIVMDISTTKEPMSLVWYKRTRGGVLPKNTFFDSKGMYTTDPWLARWVDVWGGLKGFNFSCMLQLFSGPLLGAQTEHAWENPYEVGAVFIAINPDFLQSRSTVEKSTTDFIRFLKKNNVILPGDHGRAVYTLNKKKKTIILSEQVWGWLNLL